MSNNNLVERYNKKWNLICKSFLSEFVASRVKFVIYDDYILHEFIDILENYCVNKIPKTNFISAYVMNKSNIIAHGNTVIMTMASRMSKCYVGDDCHTCGCKECLCMRLVTLDANMLIYIREEALSF